MKVTHRQLKKIIREAILLTEKKWTDLNAPKGQVIPLTPEDFDEDDPVERDLNDEIFDLIQTAYAEVPLSGGRFGNIKVQKPEDLPAGYTHMKAANIDDDPEPDYFRGGKMRGGRYKMGIVGHDDSTAAKDLYKQQTADGLMSGDIAELSGGVAHVMITRFGVPAVTDHAAVEDMLKKGVTWVGRHPDEKYANRLDNHGDYEGWYRRGISGESHLKILLGGGGD